MPRWSFGRIYIPDSRDAKYPIRKQSTRRTFRYWWANGWWGDQKNTPQCVAYALVHWLEDGPVTQRQAVPCIKPATVYRRAQELDEWPGENYEGTSVRGGAKALQEWGYIKEYRWTSKLSVLISTILESGPVVVGTSWYDKMSYPDDSGLIHIAGELVGGHAYLINGVNCQTELFRFKQSWNRNWGRNGHGYISFDDMRKLIEDEDGEVCQAIEVAH